MPGRRYSDDDYMKAARYVMFRDGTVSDHRIGQVMLVSSEAVALRRRRMEANGSWNFTSGSPGKPKRGMSYAQRQAERNKMLAEKTAKQLMQVQTAEVELHAEGKSVSHATVAERCQISLSVSQRLRTLLARKGMSLIPTASERNQNRPSEIPVVLKPKTRPPQPEAKPKRLVTSPWNSILDWEYRNLLRWNKIARERDGIPAKPKRRQVA